MPEIKIHPYNFFIFPVFNNERQIWGMINPIKLIGPVNAVAADVSKAVANKINKRSCFVLIPNDKAYFSPNSIITNIY